MAAAFGWGIASLLLSPCHLTSVPLIVGLLTVAIVFFVVGLSLLDVLSMTWAVPDAGAWRGRGLPAAFVLGLLFGVAPDIESDCQTGTALPANWAQGVLQFPVLGS